MAKNFIQRDRSIQMIAVAAIVGGTVVQQQDLVGVAESDAAIGDTFTLNLEGAYDTLAKKPAEAWAKGQKIYFDSATGNLTTDNTKMWAGYAYADALAADVVGAIILKQ